MRTIIKGLFLAPLAIASPVAAQVAMPNIATSQVAVGTTSTLVAPARQGRLRITYSIGAANQCYSGTVTVSPTTGFALNPTAGATQTLEYYGALYGVCAATTTVSVLEQY